MNDVRAAARAAYRAGLCVVPPREDGSKAPVAEWKDYQLKRPTRDQMALWFNGGSRHGVGALTGRVSRNLELFEFDDGDTYITFRDTAESIGLESVIERIERGYLERTPGGGVHWLYHCDNVRGNTKLARRLKLPDEMKHERDRYKTLIETKGEGGYVVLAPSGGPVHENGGSYTLERGGFDSIVTIAADERNALWDLAKAFDRLPKVEYQPRGATPGSEDSGRPGDVFNERGPEWNAILDGWALVYRRGQKQLWRRPGKGRGVSATINGPGIGPDRLYVFSSSTAFEPERSYSKFQAYAILDHDGDFNAAAKQLHRDGYRHDDTAQLIISNGVHKEPQSGLPDIKASEQHLPTITGQAWAALQQANQTPYLFRFGGLPSRIEHDDDGAPSPRTLTDSRLRHELARAATWHKLTKDGERYDAMPPMPVVQDMLAHPNIPLPVLTGIIEAPSFNPDGSLHCEPGYNPAGRTYYAPAPGFSVRVIAAEPPAADVERARRLILGDLLCDFPFTNDSESAHAVGLLLLPFVRGLITSPTPLHLIEKPTPGTGATLLTEVVTYPATGRAITAMTEGRDEDEWRKRITAKLRGGGHEMFIDNLKRPLISATLAAAMTATVWEDRLLGTSDTTRLPIRCSWIAIGNNPTLSSEIARRTVRIRLDAKQDRPWQRENFRHGDLRGWMKEQRAEIGWAALTFAQGWIAAGRPLPEDHQRLGMYESWSDVIGGILSHSGIPGFLSNLDDFYDTTDTEGEMVRAFLAGWYEMRGERSIGVSDLYDLAADVLDLGDGNERSQKIKLGKHLTELKDRVYTLTPELTVQIVKGKSVNRLQQWSLKRPLL